MNHVLTFIWGDLYPSAYVDRLADAVRRNMTVGYRFTVVTDRPRTFASPHIDICADLVDQHLTEIQGCFARLRLFDPQWQKKLGIDEGDKVLLLDIDLIVTGPIDDLFQRTEPFVILQNVNSEEHPCRFNGSVWLLTAGYRPDVWYSFTLDEAEKAPKLAFADDQGWLQHKIPDAGEFSGRDDGVYAFRKGRGRSAWPNTILLPNGARIVAFPGSRDPRDFVVFPWVRQHWFGADRP